MSAGGFEALALKYDCNNTHTTEVLAISGLPCLWMEKIPGTENFFKLQTAHTKKQNFGSIGM